MCVGGGGGGAQYCHGYETLPYTLNWKIKFKNPRARVQAWKQFRGLVVFGPYTMKVQSIGKRGSQERL